MALPVAGPGSLGAAWRLEAGRNLVPASKGLDALRICRSPLAASRRAHHEG